MGTRDKRVDAYIAKSADFAKPILKQLRDTIHAASPDIDEAIKWGHPTFMHQGILCRIAAFKEHCTLGFWKGALVVGSDGHEADEAMGQFGRITAVSELPTKKVLIGYVKEAMRLNREGIKIVRKIKPKPRLVVPNDLLVALKRNNKAAASFEKLPPSHQREYVQWITEAKQDATRARRLAQAVEWMAEGKSRNWQYESR